LDPWRWFGLVRWERQDWGRGWENSPGPWPGPHPDSPPTVVTLSVSVAALGGLARAGKRGVGVRGPKSGHKPPPQPRHSDGTLMLVRTGPSLPAARTRHSWRTADRGPPGRCAQGQMARHQPATRAHASPRHPAPALLASCGKADKPARQTSTHHAGNHRWQQPGWGIPVCLQLCGWRPTLYRTRYRPCVQTRRVVGAHYPGRPSGSRALTSTVAG
jgi:hypothetical protein